MSEYRKLAQDTILFGIAKMGGLLSMLVLLPFMTARLTEGEYGLIDLIVSYGGLITPILLLSLEQGVWRFLMDARGDEEYKAAIISTAFFTALPFTVAVSSLYFVVMQFVDYNFAFELFFYMVSISGSSFTAYSLRGLGKNGLFAVSSMAQTLLNIIGIIVALTVFNAGVSGILVAYGLTGLLVSAFNIVAGKIYAYLRPKAARSGLSKELVRFSLPSIPNSISWWVIGASDRTIVALILGLAANGVYAISNKFASVLGMVQSVFSAAWMESATLYESKDSHERDVFFSSVFDQQLRIFGSFALLLVSTVGLFFPVLVDESFSEARMYIPILVFGGLISVISGYYSGIYFAKKMPKKTAKQSAWTAVINIVVNLGLIWFIGLWAAVVSTVIAYGAITIYRYFDMKKHMNIKYDKFLFVKLCASLAIIFVLYYCDLSVLNVVNIVLAAIISVGLNGSLLKNGCKGLLSLWSIRAK